MMFPAAAAIFLAILALPATAAEDAVVAGRACVVDGDSLFVGGARVDGWCRRGVAVRLHGIDAPEWNQTCRLADGEAWPCGREATAMARRMVDGRLVVCTVLDRDRYGRSVAICTVGGEDVGRALVGAGLAVAYRRYSKRYVAAEEVAREAGLGMWRGEFIRPKDWRRAHPQKRKRRRK